MHSSGRCGCRRHGFIGTQSNHIQPDRSRDTQNDRFQRAPVLRQQVNKLKKWLRRIQKLVHRSCPDLFPRHRHTLKLRIDLFRRAQHCIFHNISGDLSLGSHFPDLTDAYTQIIRNGLDDIGRCFKYRIQFLTTQDTRSKSLRQLQRGRIHFLLGCACYHKRLVQCFGKSDGFLIGFPYASGTQCQLRHHIRGLQVSRPGILRGCKNLVLQICR